MCGQGVPTVAHANARLFLPHGPTPSCLVLLGSGSVRGVGSLSPSLQSLEAGAMAPGPQRFLLAECVHHHGQVDPD